MASLLWSGERTVETAHATLASGVEVALHLPAGFHHAVCAHFDVAPDAGPEVLDIEGGVELLARFAAIRGLEPLARLGERLVDEPLRVHIVSPGPTVAIRRGRTQRAS